MAADWLVYGKIMVTGRARRARTLHRGFGGFGPQCIYGRVSERFIVGIPTACQQLITYVGCVEYDIKTMFYCEQNYIKMYSYNVQNIIKYSVPSTEKKYLCDTFNNWNKWKHFKWTRISIKKIFLPILGLPISVVCQIVQLHMKLHNFE